VIDFIGVKYFAIFNLADSYITIGAMLYIIALYTLKEKK
jgi:signal peptidase II